MAYLEYPIGSPEVQYLYIPEGERRCMRGDNISKRLGGIDEESYSTTPWTETIEDEDEEGIARQLPHPLKRLRER